jgi:hypothetical protein
MLMGAAFMLPVAGRMKVASSAKIAAPAQSVYGDAVKTSTYFMTAGVSVPARSPRGEIQYALAAWSPKRTMMYITNAGHCQA